MNILCHHDNRKRSPKLFQEGENMLEEKRASTYKPDFAQHEM